MSISPHEQAVALLRRSQKVLVVAPQQAGGDLISALAATKYVLTHAGKDVIAVADLELPANYDFLGVKELIRSDLGEDGDFVISLSTEKAKVDRVKYTIKDEAVDIIISPKSGFFNADDVTFHQSAGNFDLIVVLGADSLDQLGTTFAENTQLFATAPIINVSVSATSDFFGKANVVDPVRSSVCEMLFTLFEEKQSFSQYLDETAATMLLTGIIAQTSSFQEAATSASSFEVAAHLQALGARQSDIIEHLFKKKSLATLKVWGRIFSNLELDTVHRVAWSSLAKADFELAHAQREDIGPMVDELLRHTRGAELTVLFAESKKQTHIQIRSNVPSVDMNQLQAALGGGGERVDNGLNFIIPKKSVAEIQFEFLKLLVEFQKQRLHIPAELELQKVELTQVIEDKAQQTPLPTMSPAKTPAVSPTPPAEVPFEAPFKTQEITGKVKDKTPDAPPGTQAAEVTLKPHNENIPNWLRDAMKKD